MVDKERVEIQTIKAQIQKKNEQMSKPAATPSSSTPSAGSQANMAWEDDGSASGKKFKFIHIIVVSIIFLLLGSYLAKVPLPIETPTITEPAGKAAAVDEKVSENSN
jgi:hypothetical protein